MNLLPADAPTRAEAERDLAATRPVTPSPEYLEMLRRTDPWNPENQRPS